MARRRFDHSLLYGPDIEKNLDFFEKALDFRCAERVDMPDGLLAIWMTCGMKAHDIAFVKHPEPGKLHHVAFELENWKRSATPRDIITRYDISVDIGPTRHGITRGQTIYFFDPSGNRCEVFAGGYTYYPDQPTRTWDETQVGKGIFYYERADERGVPVGRLVRPIDDLKNDPSRSREGSDTMTTQLTACAKRELRSGRHMQIAILVARSVRPRRSAVEAAVAKGRERGVAVVAAVVDIGGDLDGLPAR